MKRFLIYKNKAEAKQKKGEHKEALSYYQKALNRSPQDSQIWFEMGCCFYSLMDYERALQTSLKSAEMDDQQAMTWYNAGISCLALEREEEALGYLDRALNLYPAYSNALITRGRVYAILEDWNNSLQDFSSALKCRDISFSQLKECLLQRGKVYLELKAVDFALQDFSNLLKKDPENIEALKERGHVFLKENDLDSALKDLDLCIMLDENNLEIKFLRGAIFLKMNRNQEACQAFLSMGS